MAEVPSQERERETSISHNWCLFRGARPATEERPPQGPRYTARTRGRRQSWGVRSSHTPGCQGHVWAASGLEFSAYVILGLNRNKGGVQPAWAGRTRIKSHHAEWGGPHFPPIASDGQRGEPQTQIVTPKREVSGPDTAKAGRSVRAAQHAARGRRGNVPSGSREVLAAGACGGRSHVHREGAGRGKDNTEASVCTSPTSNYDAPTAATFYSTK